METSIKQAAVTKRMRALPKDADEIIETLRVCVPAIASVFGPNAEVILHDLRNPEASIVAIANGNITGRRLGGALVGGPFGDRAYQWLTQYGQETQTMTYETRASDGKRLRSTTVLYRDTNRKPACALCINVDISGLEAMRRWLDAALATDSEHADIVHERVESASDVEDVLRGLLEDALALLPSGRTGKLSKANRLQVVKELDDRGAFLIRSAVKRVARALGVSKYTVYSDLDTVRNEVGGAEEPVA